MNKLKKNKNPKIQMIFIKIVIILNYKSVFKNNNNN